jgi:hypothetical protein
LNGITIKYFEGVDTHQAGKCDYTKSTIFAPPYNRIIQGIDIVYNNIFTSTIALGY